MRTRTTVTITTECEVNPEEYELMGEVAFLEMDKRYIEMNPASLLNDAGTKVEVNVERIKDD